MPSIAFGSRPSFFSATSDEAPKSTTRFALAVSSQKQVFIRPPDPKASPQPTMVSFIGFLKPSRLAAPPPSRASV